MSTTLQAQSSDERKEKFWEEVNALQKGGRITRQRIEEYTDVSYDEKDFSLKALALVEAINEAFYECGKQWIVRQDKGSIVICTDPEADEYLIHREDLDIRRLRRNHHRYQTIDLSQLTRQAAARHEQRELYIGRVINSIDQIRRQMIPKAHKPYLDPRLENKGNGEGDDKGETSD